MTLPQVIGELLPVAFDGLISEVLSKHNLPYPSPDEDTTLDEVMANGVSPDDIRSEIYQALQGKIPLDFPLASFLSWFRQMPGDVPLWAALEATGKVVPQDLTIGNTIHRYIDNLLDPHIQRLADQLTLYALTGKTTPMLESSFGGVFSVPGLGQPMIVLAASQLSDTQSLIRKFRQELKQTFPGKPRAISNAMIPAATALRQKLEGFKIKDIADIYISRHPSEFPKDPLSPKYRAAKKRQEERIKKQIARLRSMLQAFGDS
jgi:hypothetical protein